LTTDLNALKINYKLGRKVAAKMAVDGFAAPVLMPNAANVRQAEGVGQDNI
jgi:hypothetical protein